MFSHICGEFGGQLEIGIRVGSVPEELGMCGHHIYSVAKGALGQMAALWKEINSIGNNVE